MLLPRAVVEILKRRAATAAALSPAELTSTDLKERHYCHPPFIYCCLHFWVPDVKDHNIQNCIYRKK